MPDPAFSVHHDADTGVLAVSGEIDEAYATVLRSAMSERSVGWTTDLVVDLTAVTYLPSVAVGVLARARQKLTSSGADLDLVAADGSVAQRVLAVCALPHRTV